MAQGNADDKGGEEILRAEDLGVRYGDFTAVQSVSLSLWKGRACALMGANGAGKSTLLHALAGLAAPFRGKIYFKEEDVTGHSAAQMAERGLSLVPQGGRVFPRMSVYDNLMMGSFPRRARKGARASLQRVYGLFPVLREKQGDLAGSLSGGQRQMLAIGRALMSQPEVLLFDEISLGLAPLVIKDIYRSIRRIREEESLAILLVEQDSHRAMHFADDCHVMLKGEIVLSGAAGELSEEAVKKAFFGL